MSANLRVAREKVTAIRFGSRAYTGIYGILGDLKKHLEQELGWELEGAITYVDGVVLSDDEALVPQGSTIEFQKKDAGEKGK